MNFRGILVRAVRILLRNRPSCILQRCEYSDGVVKSPHGAMEFPSGRVHECFYEKFEKFGNKPAVECSLTGRKYTYDEIRKFAGALAASMQNKLKLDKGDSVALFLPNLPEYPIIFFAASESGVISTTINPNYTPGELVRHLEISRAKAIFTTINRFEVVQSTFKVMQKMLPVIIVKEKEDATIPPGAANFAEFIDSSTCGQLRRVDTTNEDVFVLPFSSGTSGLPKGVELIHRNIVSNVNQIGHSKSKFLDEAMEVDSVLAILPMFHIYGMTCVTLTTLYTGGLLLSMQQFDPAHFLETIVRKKIRTLYVVPPLVLFLTNAPMVTPETLKYTKYIVIGASPIGHSDLEKFTQKHKHVYIGQGYGMTETGPVVLMFEKERMHKYGACGVPVISTEVKVVDPDTLKPLKVKEVGELWVKGPQIMKGYYNNPKATSEIFVDGWLRTGDLAYYDEEGDFFICDRIKDMIKVKGFQVAPAELEEILRSHPKIVDAAVIGVRHPTKGEVPKAFVVLHKGQTATEEEIKDFVKTKVAKHKELDGGVVFRESIPKSVSGKILKKELPKT